MGDTDRDAGGAAPPWFTVTEAKAIEDAYEALTRIGNATEDRLVQGPDTDYWDPVLDRAHHDLGLVLVMLHRHEAVEAVAEQP